MKRNKIFLRGQSESHSISRYLFGKNVPAAMFVFSLLCFFSTDFYGQINTIITYTASGTWTAPTGITSVTVTCLGGGGAGGGASGNPATGGGGAGGSCVTSVLTVAPYSVYVVTVGGSKTATATSSAATNKGNPSWFNTAGTIYAAGGNGGTPQAGNSANGAAGTGNTTGCIGTTQYAGGSGSVGVYTSATGYSGAGGGGAGSTGAGEDASAGAGGTGTTLNGGNGANGVGNTMPGTAGFNYGGGGSGAKANNNTDQAGGTGAQGLVTIIYVINNAIFSGGSSDGFALSRIGGSGTEVPLPVELLLFDAKNQGNKVDVSWTTASEFNSDYFIVLRSKEGIDFEQVGQVNAAGTNSTTKEYSLVDMEPYSGISYYRLKQVDYDGKFTLSKLVSVNFKDDQGIAVYPNPANGEFNVSLKTNRGEEVVIVLRDLLGNQFYSKAIVASDTNEIIVVEPSSKIPAGMYMVVATSRNSIFREKVIIK